MDKNETKLLPVFFAGIICGAALYSLILLAGLVETEYKFTWYGLFKDLGSSFAAVVTMIALFFGWKMHLDVIKQNERHHTSEYNAGVMRLHTNIKLIQSSIERVKLCSAYDREDNEYYHRLFTVIILLAKQSRRYIHNETEQFNRLSGDLYKLSQKLRIVADPFINNVFDNTYDIKKKSFRFGQTPEMFENIIRDPLEKVLHSYGLCCSEFLNLYDTPNNR